MTFDDMFTSIGEGSTFSDSIQEALYSMALTMAVGGYDLLKNRMGPLDNRWWGKENIFNYELTAAMNQFRTQKRDQQHSEFGWEDVSVQYQPIETEGRSFVASGDPDQLPRPDIGVYHLRSFHDIDPYFIIEGKRLNKADGKLTSEYVVNGMERFRDGRYAYSHQMCAMVGYVETGFEVLAVQKINRTATSMGYAQSECLEPAPPIDSFKSGYISSHSRTGSDSLKMYHLMLEFDRSA